MLAARHASARRTAGHPVPSGRTLALTAIVVAAGALGLYLLLPRLAGLDDTWERLDEGEPWWLLAAFGLEVASYGSYVVLLRAIFARPPVRLGWRRCTLITLAGVAASRLLAAGGAGGIAVTVWAMRRAGLGRRPVAERMTAFMVVLYGIFMIALLVGGAGLYLGVFAGRSPFALTVVPAIFGASVIVTALLLALVPHDLADGRSRGVVHGLSTASATVGDGVRAALRIVFVRRDVRVLAGGIGWWAFDIAVLGSCLHAFGGAAPVAVIVMAYFVGQLGNLLPVPGGIGGVDGALIGALIGFGVPAGLAIAAVLAYRAFAFWLPTIPGAFAYVALLRSR